jgi:hypothetical protein
MNILSNSRTIEEEKVYCPKDGVVMVRYDRRHKPKISVFTGE